MNDAKDIYYIDNGLFVVEFPYNYTKLKITCKIDFRNNKEFRCIHR